MNFFKKVQKTDVFLKKIIVFSIIIFLAVPLSFLVVNRFQKRVKNFDTREFLKESNLPNFKEEIGDAFFEELQEVNETTSTVPTSTLISTSTNTQY